MRQAIILCSGGLDSVTTAHYVTKRLNYQKILLIFFNYRQRNFLGEKATVKKCAKSINSGIIEINVKELSNFSSSSLNSSNLPRASISLKNTSKESRKWYVPARNIVFLSYALSISDSIFQRNKQKSDIFMGFKCEGEEHYPDATKEFVRKLNQISKASTESKPKIIAPLINKDKEDIILLADRLGVSLKDSFSCYVGPKIHCGKCLACRIRKAGFYWANINDPTRYTSLHCSGGIFRQ